MSTEIKKEIQLEIAHVLFMDIVGYSKLPINEQRALLDTLNQIVRSTEEFQTAEATGRLIKISTGDGMALVFYNSPEAPVECALDISRALKTHRNLPLRMGVHSGPVSGVIDVNERANVAGVGINMAQRVMDCGDAGHILLSKRVAEDLEQYPHWQPHLHYLGECEVKHGIRVHIVNLYTDELGNPGPPEKFKQLRSKEITGAAISRTLRRRRRRNVFLLGSLGIAVSLIAGFFLLPHASARKLDKSIAVLPFESFSDDKENAFFADGIQDDILTNLAKIGDLKVISRTSVMPYRGKEKNVREIGQALGVSTILEGSVRKSGNRVRLNVQLINAVNDEHIWAEDYDRDLTDVFAIQTDLAQKIAHELQAKLSPAEKAQMTRKPTENGEAYLAFVQARNLHMHLEDFDQLKQAEQPYERALQMDPNFALACADFSRLESWIYHTFDPTPPRREKARSLADRALKLQPDCPECHLALGISFYYDRDYENGLKEFAIAQRGLPNESEVYLATGAIQRRQGKWTESTANLEKAVALRPVETSTLQNLVFNYQMLRDFDAANKTIDRALKLRPESIDLWGIKARLEIVGKGTFEIAERGAEFLSTSSMPEKEKARLAAGIVQTRLLQGKYADALHEAENVKDELVAEETEGLISKYETIGIAKKMLKDEAGAREAFLTSRRYAERYLSEAPNEATRYATLAEILAWLGEKDAAIAEAKRATEMLPESVDALDGPEMTKTLAEVYAIVGEQEKAIDLLDGLLSRPSPVTVATLKFILIWGPLHDNPRFIELLKKYGGPA